MSQKQRHTPFSQKGRNQVLTAMRERGLLAIILLGALGLRLWHLTWGLPYVHEEAYPFYAAWKYWNFGGAGLQFNPHVFYYPALSAHIQFIGQVLHYGIGRIVGAYPDLETYRVAFLNNPTTFLVLGRLATTLLDVGTVWLVYAIGRRLISSRGGLIAAAIVGVNVLHVRQAQTIAVDTPTAFFVVLALYMIIRVYKTGTVRWYILGGISIGLAAATRYTAALLLIPFCAASLLRASTVKDALRSLRTAELLSGVVLSGLVFLQLNPYLILDYSTFVRDFGVAQGNVQGGQAGLSPSGVSVADHSLNLVPDAIGWPMLIIVVLSTLILLWRRRRDDLILLAFPIMYVALLGVRATRGEYYLLPLVPFLVLIAVRGLQEFRLTLLPKAMEGRRVVFGIVTVVLGVAVLAPSVTGLIARETVRALPDTREAAREWIVSSVRFGSAMATGPLELNLPLDKYLVFPLPYDPVRSEHMAPFYSTAWYTDLDFFVGSSLEYAQFRQNPERYRPYLAFYDSLKTRWKLIYSVKPAPHQSGPELWIFQPPQHVTNGLFDTSMVRSLSKFGNTATSINFAGKLAMILALRGLLDRSTQMLQYVVQADPQSRTGYRELASVLYQRGKVREALQAADTALRLEPNDAEMLTAKGNILMELQQTVEAETFFRRALELDRLQEAAYIGLTRLYELRGDTKRALEIVKQYRGILRSGDDKARVLDAKIKKLGG